MISKEDSKFNDSTKFNEIINNKDLLLKEKYEEIKKLLISKDIIIKLLIDNNKELETKIENDTLTSKEILFLEQKIDLLKMLKETKEKNETKKKIIIYYILH